MPKVLVVSGWFRDCIHGYICLIFEGAVWSPTDEPK